MYTFLLARTRQDDLLAEAERAHRGRLAALARRCSDAYRPSQLRRLLAVLTGRALAPAGC